MCGLLDWIIAVSRLKFRLDRDADAVAAAQTQRCDAAFQCAASTRGAASSDALPLDPTRVTERDRRRR